MKILFHVRQLSPVSDRLSSLLCHTDESIIPTMADIKRKPQLRVRVEQEQLNSLKTHANRENKTLSEMVRMILTRGIRAYEGAKARMR